MKVYYREGDVAFYGDMAYYPDSTNGVLVFRFVDRQRNKTLSLHDAQLVTIGSSRVHFQHAGVDYLFYTERPDWIEMVPKIADWLLQNEKPAGSLPSETNK